MVAGSEQTIDWNSADEDPREEPNEMSRTRKKPAVAAHDLEAAFNEWKKKEKRFKTVAHGKREYPDPIIDTAARHAEASFNVLYKLLLRATGAKRNQTCVAILPDGSHLVALHDPVDQIGQDWAKVQLVPARRVAKLS
jgi:hypothetical protein